MYDAERSTLLGSLPENAPPPWLPTPPYVSTMILRPVSPVSPMGPPTTNRPVGLMWYFTLRGSKMKYHINPTGRIDVVFHAEGVEDVLGHDGLDHVFDHVPLDLLAGNTDRKSTRLNSS